MQNNVLLKYNRKEEWDRLKACLIPTFVIGLIAHAYGFLHNIFAHDSLNAFYADATEEKWKIALGRFLVPVFRKILVGPVALPWVIGLISLLFISVSMYFITKMFDVDYNRKLPIILIAGVMVTNVTITSGVSTYIYELHFDMLALLFSCLAAYLWSKYDKVGWYALSSLLLAMSVALYQSYFEVFVILLILFSVVRLLDGDKFADVFKKIFKGFIVTAAGMGVYFVSNKVVFLITGIEPQVRTSTFNISAKSILTMFKRIGKFYLEPASVYSTVLFGVINALLLALVVVFIIICMKKLGKGNVKEKLLVALLGIIALISIDIIAVTGTKVHDLMVYSFWILFTFPIILIFSDRGSNTKIFKPICAVLVILILWNNILISNTAYIKRDNEQAGTLSVMTRVIDDLEDRDDYVVGKSEIIFVGKIDVFEKSEEYMPLSGMEGVRFGVIKGSYEDEWYYNSYQAYFKYFLDYPLNYSDKVFTDKKEVAEMPCYPSDGYIQNIDGVLVVKLGELGTKITE